MRSATALFAVLAALLLPGTARAGDCNADAFDQSDLAGVYSSREHQMMLTVEPCGPARLLWSNPYGTHAAGYYGTERLPGGGVISVLTQPDPWARSLDGRNVLAYEPAEPGYLTLITAGPFGEDFRVYRLTKRR